MNTRHRSILASDLQRLDRVVQLLEEEWSRHGDVELQRFWTEQQRVQSFDSVDSVGLLVELIKADLRCRFDQGQTPTVAEYLERFPELRGADTRVLSLIYEEFCLGEEHGRAPDVESFCERYPDWKDSLASQLRYHHLISKAAGLRPSLPQYPNPGDDFEEFHLDSLLGTGGTSRVFLARDNSLGGKRVVLKVSLDRGQEPKAQGRLDHPHIVPVNSVTYQPGGQLRGLSMPFRVGQPLDEIIKRAKPAERPRKAIALWHALVDEASDHLTPGTTGKPARMPNVGARRHGPRGDGWEGFPVRGTYDQGVAWIVMTVARALHYAHDMHTFHRDVKPANVLLTLRHGPQLFDFNLADSPHSAHQAQAALHGGTLPYMAPEQIEAFLNPELWGKVAAKADIYSLGLVFRELLTGVMPELPPETLSPQRALRHVLDRRPFLEVSVRRLHPKVPHALDAVVAKCLALSPDDRYPDAQALAQDLDRFLKHQPLLQAANPSRRERLDNWVIRHRRAFATSFACLIAFIVSVVLFYPRINERLKKPIETLPGFRSAIEYLNQYESKRALNLLLSLEQDYAQSPLLQLYLSFALNDEKESKEAELHFAAVAAAWKKDPGAEKTLVEWVKGHPEVVSILEEFAEERFNFASILTEQNVKKKDYEGEEDDVKVQEPYYKPARDALQLAVRLKPDSQEAQRLLAKAEDFFGEYPSANDRITRWLDWSYSVSEEAKELAKGKRMNKRIYSHALRCRIATHWAESLRVRGPSQATLGPFELMQNAEQDLNMYERLLSKSASEAQSANIREFLKTKLKAMLILCEVEMDRLLLPDANRHLEQAKKTLGELITHAEKMGSAIPNEAPERQRCNEDQSRLDSLRSSQATRVAAHPAKPG